MTCDDNVGAAETQWDSGYSRYGDDRLREECGVFGILGHPDAAALTALGLHALQHRGQEAAGIVTYDGHQFHSERRLGLVGDNFNKGSVIKRLMGSMAVGHNRYSTTGNTLIRNVQPLFADLDTGGFALAHNGNLTNALTLRRDLISSGAICQSTSDSEVILHLLARSNKRRIVERFVDAIRQIEGAYALVCLTNDMMIGARDPIGIRPLIIGKIDGCYVLASETCALDIVGAKFVREVENGEVVVITEAGLESHRPFPRRPARPCIFEYIYFARPDSIVGGRSVYDIRKQMGVQLAIESPADADIIVPIPDSGVPASIGYAQQSNLPFELGIIRNHYVGRTFIEPEQRIRALGVKLKHSANASIISGKSIVLIDDSVVRGTTSKKIVQLMYEAGAREVHMRIACPPITHSDYYGIDTPSTEELLAAKFDVEGMRKFMGAHSLAFLSIDGIYRSVGFEGRDPNAPQFTDHCLTGEYPTPLTDQTGDPAARQLSLLAEVS
ncbi:Amidophosphoribosyltransferase [Candidatus Filomicrobium marinum]|uniref:Amidophosphoribosyltransferase n=2 Tax=Filomicrobium TaxID=119044 RepID=A0A0D6JIF5_9HYPH|nr:MULTISPECIES: amidophosphoribosyltransferase [Filomicrobium]CFX36951.1 Amidophosphoribosyltransferase [Candidatus Filomicrobium marinum]CPR21681.1 Amidophosphoribosyltransferase [Candidatus Filomicrobium marinum]SDP62793.1 amidophosphoribosyltransferase [Filomicrobium insigne]